MLVHREQTPVALRTVHVLKGRRARSLLRPHRTGRYHDAAALPRRGCPDVPIFDLVFTSP